MTASLRAYLNSYAAGEVSREEMISTVAAWPFEERDFDPAHTLPDHQDNTTDVVGHAMLLDKITEEDYEEIFRRRQSL
ncbi:hypothetical protein ACFV7Q_09820 [Streptomyces sp. NPDC059851]|uniref:hypothetical protein n=1 Tax=Streptomyces sp. NPDC059851 TaxID=3346971 RepID=UPI00364A6F23